MSEITIDIPTKDKAVETTRRRIPQKMHPSARRPLKLLLKQKDALIDVANQRAEIDELTELPNDKALQKIMMHFIEQGMREKKPFALIEGDLGGLKWTNDNLGDTQGDKLIKDTAKILQGNVRHLTDSVVRPHGDTFLVFLADANKEVLESFFQKIQPQFKNGNPLLQADGNIGISMGAIVIRPEQLPTPITLRGTGLVERENLYQSMANSILADANLAMRDAKGPIEHRGLPPNPDANSFSILASDPNKIYG